MLSRRQTESICHAREHAFCPCEKLVRRALLQQLPPSEHKEGVIVDDSDETVRNGQHGASVEFGAKQFLRVGDGYLEHVVWLRTCLGRVSRASRDPTDERMAARDGVVGTMRGR